MTLTDDDFTEHARVYATAGLPPFALYAAGARLLHGRNPLTAVDAAALAERGVTHVLDLREPDEWASPRFGGAAVAALERLGIVRENVPVTDFSAPAPADFDAAIGFLEVALAAPEARVFVHCRAGIERSGTMLVAYRARRAGLTAAAALAALHADGARIAPLARQIEAARAWLGEGEDAPAG